MSDRVAITLALRLITRATGGNFRLVSVTIRAQTIMSTAAHRPGLSHPKWPFGTSGGTAPGSLCGAPEGPHARGRGITHEMDSAALSIRERMACTMRSRFGGSGTLSISVTQSVPNSASALRRRRANALQPERATRPFVNPKQRRPHVLDNCAAVWNRYQPKLIA